MKNLKNEKLTYYPPESAGRAMITRVPVVMEGFTVSEVESLLIKESKNFETIDYIYVVDTENNLKGVLSIKDVFSSDKKERVSDLMTKEIITARTHSDQERVVQIALKYNIKAVPVVDKNNIFLGTVPSDKILEILNSEHTEDILYSEGIQNVASANFIIKSAKKVLVIARLPWLIVGLLGGLLAAKIIGGFEELLLTEVALAMFIPVMVYMADAVGSQTQTVFIRAMAIDNKFSIKKYFSREFYLGIIISFILSLILFLTSWWWFSLEISIVVSISLFLTIISSVLIALIIPLLLLKMKVDVAVGSGPFATILRDVLSVIIYFTVAYIILILL